MAWCVLEYTTTLHAQLVTGNPAQLLAHDVMS
jgi:hypothetical protein